MSGQVLIFIHDFSLIKNILGLNAQNVYKNAGYNPGNDMSKFYNFKFIDHAVPAPVGKFHRKISKFSIYLYTLCIFA